MADQYQWLGGNGAFSDQNQWNDETADQDPAQQPPGSGDFATFLSGGTVSGGGQVMQVDVIGAEVTFNGNITASGGIIISADSTVTLNSGGGLTASGSIVDVDASTLTVNGGSIDVGIGGFGASDGASIILQSGGEISGGDVGVQSGADLHVESGATIDLSSGAGNFSIGSPGDGSPTFELDAGGVVNDQVGVDSGTVTVNGGDWSNQSGLAIGLFAPGTLILTDGTVSTSEGGGTGGFLSSGEALAIGALSGDDGTVEVSGGTLIANSDTNIVGGQGDGLLSVTGGDVSISGTLDFGVMSGGTGTLVVSGGTLSVGQALVIGDAGSGTGTISTGETVAVTSGLTIGAQSGGDGTLTITDSATQVDVTGGSATIGASGDGSLVLQSGGGLLVNSGSVVIGGASGGSGTVTVNGSGSTLSASNGLIIGNSGTGALVVQSGATVSLSSGTLDLGASSGGSGSATVTGNNSTLGTQKDVIVGDQGSGTLTISSGADFNDPAGTLTIGNGVNATGTMAVSGASTTVQIKAVELGVMGDGTLTVSSGAKVDSNQDITIAAVASSLSALNVSGTGSTAQTDGSMTVGGDGDGNVNIQSGGSVQISSEGSLVIGDSANGAGDVEVDGNLGVGQGIVVGNAGDGTLDVQANGSVDLAGGDIDIAMAGSSTGTLSLSADGASLMAPANVIVGDSGTGTLQVTAGTTLNASAGTITIGSATNGVGALSVSGANAMVSAGGLIIGATGDGTLAADSGGTISASDTVVIGQNADGFGTLTLDGDNTNFTAGADVIVGASGDGTVSVQGGATLDVSSGAVVIASAADSSGLITLAGSESPLAIGKDLTIGLSGDGTLDVQSGVTLDVNSGTIDVGAQQNSSGEVTLAGTGTVLSAGQAMTIGDAGEGTLTIGENVGVAVTGALDIGKATSGTGAVALSGSMSALTASDDVTVGDSGAGSITIADGGSLDASSGTLTIGAADGGNGTLAVSGSSAAVSIGSLVVGDTGKGTLTLDSGSQFTTSDDVTIGASMGGSGTVSVSGDDSLLSDGGTLTVGDAGSGEIDVNQGSVDVFSGAVTLGQSAGGSGSINLQNTSLNLSGSLLIGGAGSGSLEVGKGGSLQAQDITLGSVTNGSGNLLVDGGGSAQSSNLTIGLNGQGGLEVSASGVLQTTGQAVIGVGALPVVEQQANILTKGTWSVGALLDDGQGGNGAITINSGGLVTALSVTLGDQHNATGTLAVSGTMGATPAELQYGSSLLVGDDGQGTLAIAQAGTVTAASGTIEIGVANGATGNVSLTDAGSLLDATLLTIGGSGLSAGGSGTLSIGTGANVQASTVTVWGGGTITLAGGTLTTDPITVDGVISGAGTITGGITNSGTIIADNGTLVLAGGLGGSGTIGFAGTATLILETPGSGITMPVVGLDDSDRIEFAGLAITGAHVSSPGTITINTTGAPYLLTDASFAADAPQAFVIGTDASTGNAFIEVACFAAGTRIATERGEVPVEALQVGDRVATARSGDVYPIVWIGYRHVDCARHPEPRRVWPVRIRAGAFGPGRPHRNLYLSPDHAVFVDGVLIPIKYLIDGDAIRQVRTREVTYYHLELPQHDVLLANGLATESYLSSEDRSDFANGGGPMKLHPDFAVRQWEAFACAPLVVTGPAIAAVRRRVGSIDLEHALNLDRRVSR